MIKKYWWIVGGGIILMILLWPKNTKITQQTPEPLVKEVRYDLFLPADLPQVENVNWLSNENIELPIIKNNKIRRQTIEIERELRIKKLLGINDKNGYIDKENNIVAFTEEIKNSQQLPTEGKWEIEKLKSKLSKIVEEINERGKLEIEWTNVKYQKILYPRWIEAREEDAQSVEIRGNYILEGKEMCTYHGESIRGTFNKKGELIKIYLSLRPEMLVGTENLQLLNIQEVSKSPTNLYGVVDNAGIENIKSATITQNKIVLIYDNKRNIVKPYYWLEGNTFNENKPIKISLITKAEE